MSVENRVFGPMMPDKDGNVHVTNTYGESERMPSKELEKYIAENPDTAYSWGDSMTVTFDHENEGEK